MHDLLKPLLVSVAMISGWASRAHAEQFDTSYHGNGRYIEQWGGQDRRALAMFEQPDGSIVQVSTRMGGCGAATACPAFTSLTANGTYLTSVSPYTANMESITAAVNDSHGRIIVVGSTSVSVNSNFRVVRYLPNGDLDTSFGTGGKVDVDFFGANDYANAVAIDGDDNIFVAGQAGISATDTDFGVAKLRGSNGSLDTSFGGNGKNSIAFDLGSGTKFDVAHAIAVSADGSRITLVGDAFDSNISRFKVALVRLLRNGNYDTSFCQSSCNFQGGYTSINTGRRIYFFGSQTSHTDSAKGVAVLGNGDFVIVGETFADNGSNRRAAVTRFSANGDESNEKLNLGLGDNATFSSVQVSDANGLRVLAAGHSGPSDNYLFLQAFNAALTPLNNYGTCLENNTGLCFTGGTGLGDNGPDAAVALNLDHLGRPLFASTFVADSGDYAQALFARFTNDTGPKPDRIFRSGFQ